MTNHPASGQALTAWSKDAITTSGSTDRCFAGEFVSNGGSSCPSGSDLDAQTGPGACDDDLCQDANFPSDLFKFLFGVPKAEYQKIKDQARVVADCSGLNASSSGLIWVTGSCNPSGTVGSVDAPVLLIVQGETSLNGGAKIFGFLNMFNPDSTATPKLTSNGNASIEGAVFSHRASCPETGSDKCLQLNGGFVLKYNVTVLNNIRNNPSGRALARISGAWSDMQ